MGFRFRKSLKIAPGVRWNLGLSGSSVSIGRRGASVNFSKRGARMTVGIPGTGISYSERVGGGSRKMAQTAAALPLPPATPEVNPDAMGVSPIPWKGVLGVISVGVLVLWPVWGLLGLLATMVIPSRTTLARRELTKRLTQFQEAAGGLQTSRSLADIDRVLALPATLNLPADYASGIVGQLEAVRELTVLEEAGGQLVPVEGATDVLGPERCYFLAAVFLDKHGKDENGTVYFGQERLLFIGDSRIDIPWARISSVERDDNTVVVQRTDRQTPYNFIFDASALAVKAEWVAVKLVNSDSPPTSDAGSVGSISE
jgi:hypothetical protein